MAAPISETVSLPPTDEAATVAPVPSAAGTIVESVAVPGYEIITTLGRGGMGVVYQARQTKLGRIVALKMILSGAHAGEDERLRFRTEAEAIARLQHPNIVQIYEIGEVNGLPFFSLEFCGGGSLESKLNGTPLPPKDAAALIETLARAMQTAHEKGVIHRDLKPANILLASGEASAPRCPHRGADASPLAGWTPKITDFGLAKKLDEVGQTATGAMMGTPSYMAPEQAGYSSSKSIGPAADVYALGAILYECMTGRPPFKAATQLDTILQVVADDPVSPTHLQSRTPRDLATICLKCLQKDPARRYPSAAALADDLARFQRGETIAARPSGAGERLVRWCRRRPVWAALIGASLIGLLTLLGGSLWFTRKLGQELDRTEAARQATTDAERRLQLALTREVAEGLDSDLRQLAAVPHTIAAILSERSDWTEEQLGAAMQQALGNDARLFGMCAAFEPFQFDRGREDFALYVYRSADGLRRKQLLPPAYRPYRTWEWYQATQQSGQARWSEPYFDEGGGDVPMVTFSVPVRRGGRVVGVVTADLSIEYFKGLQDDLRDLNFGPNSYGFVVSPTGRFINHPDSRFDLRRKLADVVSEQGDTGLIGLANRALRHESGEGRGTDFAGGRPARFLFAPVNSSGWSVVAVIPATEENISP